MEGFEWAENNLRVRDPRQLQEQDGVNVHFAPNIASDRKVVNLATGAIELFQHDEARPHEGCFVDFEDLERYCRRRGIPLVEVNGMAITQGLTGEAGDPILHREPGR